MGVIEISPDAEHVSNDCPSKRPFIVKTVSVDALLQVLVVMRLSVLRQNSVAEIFVKGKSIPSISLLVVTLGDDNALLN